MKVEYQKFRYNIVILSFLLKSFIDIGPEKPLNNANTNIPHQPTLSPLGQTFPTKRDPSWDAALMHNLRWWPFS